MPTEVQIYKNGTVLPADLSSGDPGGLAGCYITNNGNVTWVNTGDRRGRVC
jgi:hypothetical protein